MLSLAEALQLAERVRREGQISRSAPALSLLLTEFEKIIGPEALKILMEIEK
jgi:hypothetical protein